MENWWILVATAEEQQQEMYHSKAAMSAIIPVAADIGQADNGGVGVSYKQRPTAIVTVYNSWYRNPRNRMRRRCTS